MSQKDKKDGKLFTYPRWNEPIGGKVIGHETISEEKQKQVHEDTVAILKNMGIKLKEEK